MYKIRTALIGVAVAGLTAVGTVGTVGTASADTQGRADAKAGKICVYQHKNFGGNKECYLAGKHNLGDLDNRVSSLKNKTGTTLCVFQLKNQKGYQFAVGGDNYFRNLSKDTAPDGRSWNDRISSIGPCRS
jgi:hypothetical protein